jgi:hypothetical protein
VTSESQHRSAIKALSKTPDTIYAIVVDDASTDPVRLTIAIRNVGVGDVLIPQAKYDPAALFEMVEWYGA